MLITRGGCNGAKGMLMKLGAKRRAGTGEFCTGSGRIGKGDGSDLIGTPGKIRLSFKEVSSVQCR